jgi:hypothetical protein
MGAKFVGCTFRKLIAGEGKCIEQSIRRRDARNRFRFLFRESIAQSEQTSEKIAAIDRRDILRRKRTKRRRLVPIQKMPSELLQLVERRERAAESLGQHRQRDVPEVVRRKRRQ